MDADSNDFAAGLSLAVTRDAQGPATSVMKVNGVGATAYSATPDAGTYLILNKGVGSFPNQILGARNGVLRWHMGLGNNAAESGANVGSDFTLNRYNDAGTLVDSPITINRATGIVTISSLNVLGGFTAPISANNISASGTLSVGATSTFTGVATFNAGLGVVLSVAAGQRAEYECIVAGQRNWSMGENSNGQWRVADNTAGLERLMINSSGQVTISNTLLVSAGGDPVQITAPGGGYARYVATVTGVRSWYFGCRNDGTFSIEDSPSGAIRFQIAATGGAVTIPGSLTVSGNFATNAITCTTIGASAAVQFNTSATFLAAQHGGTNITWSPPYVLWQMQSGWYFRWSSSTGELYWIGANAGHFQLDDGAGNAVLAGNFTANGTLWVGGG
jgi:hypothetical protein